MYKFFHKDGECGGHHHDHPKEEIKQPIIPTKKANLNFEDFLNFFPPIELPFSITSDTERQIAQVQDPLNPAWVVQFLLDPDQLDEYTEFMPCFSIPNTEKFYGIIYWQASLEGNAYFLTTFSKSGNIIDHKIIAGSLYLEDALVQMVCTISEDWSILRSEAELTAKGEINKEVEPKTKFIQMTLEGELLED
jgi:hypothetical protein